MAQQVHRSGQAFDLDTINRGTWRRPDTVAAYRDLQGWTDPGEQAAVAWAASQVAGGPVLDIGVGAGRTTALLRPLGDDYLGIDYTAEMVEACRLAHPQAQFRQMDARDLSALPAGHFALAVFSFNGIDSVDRADREQVLRQVHRVLRPGGLFIVSAHNRHGPGAGERPGVRLPWSWNPLRLGWRLARSLRALPRSLRNHRRLRAANELHEDWAVLNCGAHEFGLVVVYTSLAEQVRQLREAGFQLEAVFDNVRGERVTQAADTGHAWWFHYVVRKPPAPAGISA